MFKSQEERELHYAVPSSIRVLSRLTRRRECGEGKQNFGRISARIKRAERWEETFMLAISFVLMRAREKDEKLAGKYFGFSWKSDEALITIWTFRCSSLAIKQGSLFIGFSRSRTHTQNIRAESSTKNLYNLFFFRSRCWFNDCFSEFVRQRFFVVVAAEKA